MISMDEMADAARELLGAESATAAAEAALAEAKAREARLREEVIPAMFAELGIEKLVLSDGSTFSCAQEVYASIPAARREEAYTWLEEHDFDGIIRTEVQVPFGRGELDKAQALLDELATLGITNGTIDRTIHPQTLKAFLKEQLGKQLDADSEDGAASVPRLDLDLFGARPVMQAKVKAPPKKRNNGGTGR